MPAAVPAPLPLRRRTAGRAVAAVVAVLAVAATTLSAAPAGADNRVTPGSFTGYGFDQCTAPRQRAMDAWRTSSPFWAVGIYVSGASRGCREPAEPDADLGQRQLAGGWRLLPITLGPQASCTTRERYLHQVRINPSSSDCLRLGAPPGPGRGRARRSPPPAGSGSPRAARSGTTSSRSPTSVDPVPRVGAELPVLLDPAAARPALRLRRLLQRRLGIEMLDDARADRPGRYRMPDRIWIADWNGRADIASCYVRSRRLAAPQAGCTSTRAATSRPTAACGSTSTRNWLDLGRGSRAPPEPRALRWARVVQLRQLPHPCGPATAARWCARSSACCAAAAPTPAPSTACTTPGSAPRSAATGPAGGSPPAPAPARRPGWRCCPRATRPLVKVGQRLVAVRRVQRALNAADGAGLPSPGCSTRARRPRSSATRASTAAPVPAWSPRAVAAAPVRHPLSASGLQSRSETTSRSRAAGRVAVHAARGSASGTLNWPCTSSTASGPARRSRRSGRAGRRGAPHMSVKRTSSERRHGHQHPAGGLGEQRDERVAVGQPDPGADAVAQARLDQRLRQPAVGQVVGAGRRARARRVDQQLARARFSAARSTRGGRPPRWPCTTCAHSEPESSSRVSPSR